MKEYRSPFQLPGQEKPPKCTSPDDALFYLSSHEEAGSPGAHSIWGKECPVHSKRKTAQEKSDPWLAWHKHREDYAKLDSGSEDYDYRANLAMERMLATVTLSNPPDAKPAYGIWMQAESTGRKTKTWYDIDGRPHLKEVERRVPGIYWVLAAAFAAWIAVISIGITLLGRW